MSGLVTPTASLQKMPCQLRVDGPMKGSSILKSYDSIYIL